MIMTDEQIRVAAVHSGMISPFVGDQVYEKDTMSYGLTSFGYDARLDHDVRIFYEPPFYKMIDPKRFDLLSLVEAEKLTDNSCVIPPNGYALANTIEYFKIPRNVVAVCLGKSTYARCGLIVNVTPLEPEWEGQVTLELYNATPCNLIIYPGEGICQFQFHHSDYNCDKSYKDKAGKYQGQRGVTPARMPK